MRSVILFPKRILILLGWLYEDTHQRSDGSWVHDNARMFRTIGMNPGYICVLGHEPKPSYSAKGKQTPAELERAAFEAENRAVSAEKSTAELIERVKSLEAEHLDLSSNLREEMSSKLDQA